MSVMLEIRRYVVCCMFVIFSVVLSGLAQGANVGITPASSDVTSGSVLDLRIFGDDFAKPPAIAEIEVTWDSSVLSYVSRSFVDPWTLGFSEAAINTATGVFDDLSALNLTDPPAVFDIAVLRFNVVGNPGDSTMVSLATAAGESWLDGDGANINSIVYTGANVKVVPIPAAIYLLVTGLFWLVCLGRRKPI